jgi:very-short-patch-repair endonuclease
VEHGYHVIPQYQAGAYAIDLVVVGNGNRLAIECDGENFHSPEKLQEDVERQAVLERLGWTFVRVRGSLFFRDEARAMEPVYRRLQELNVTPELTPLVPIGKPVEDDIIKKITIRADQLRTAWGGTTTARTKPQAKNKPLPVEDED